MAASDKSPVKTDGSLDFSGGVNSIKVTSLATARNPNGLARNELAWLTNATIRDGGILQRTGWIRLGHLHAGNALYQGGMMYEPLSENPYLLLSIGGHIYKVLPDFANGPIDLTANFPLTGPNPANQTTSYFVQGEQFGIIQAGDLVTLPLFWDGTTLRRSKGITNPAVAPGTPGVNEIPAAGPMDYYQGRIWYAQGRAYSAGDIVGGQSGVLLPGHEDVILNVTENPLVLGGDGFAVPTYAGNIRALFHNANLNAQLGEGQLLIGTRKVICAMQVPVTRTDWIAANANNQPIQTVVNLNNGPVNSRSIVKVNGDVFFQSLEPAIRSVFATVRNFGEWQNNPLSANVERALAFNDRSLLFASTGCNYNSRLLESVLPFKTPVGVAHQGILPLDFIPISNFGKSTMPVWEGMYEGLQILELFTGDFGGLERCFATVVSTLDGSIELWEFTDYAREDSNLSGDARVTWGFESPAFNWSNEFELKELLAAELWVDKLLGTVEFTLEYRPDSDPCWHMWHKWKQCSAKNSCEDVKNPICYPIEPRRESFRANMNLPAPKPDCVSASARPSTQGYQFQIRLTVKGWCRVRGVMLYATDKMRQLYENLVCPPANQNL